jgi:hypothetical protein
MTENVHPVSTTMLNRRPKTPPVTLKGDVKGTVATSDSTASLYGVAGGRAPAGLLLLLLLC